MQYREELVYTRSEDAHIELDGVLFRPATDPTRRVGVVWTHGAGVSFSIVEPFVRMGRALASRGFVVLIGNNRGHDFGAFNWHDGAIQLGGVAWERFE